MNIYANIIRRFPRGIVYSFAYGSGVKQQSGSENNTNQKSKVIDLMFCVENPIEWHRDNLKKHPAHYSGLRILGSRFIASYQNNLAARVYFNTLVHLADVGVTVKYGVVSREHLESDLREWRHLYFAGRLHKPVIDVIVPKGRSLVEAVEQNLQSAFVAALLMLPERFTDFDLFHTISNISYNGDFRMIFGENKRKVKNIVDAQMDDFFKLYHPEMHRLSDYVAVGVDRARNITYFEQDKSIKAKKEFLKMLPSHLKERICANSAFKGSYMEAVGNVADSKKLAELILMSVNDIVWRSSISQSLKNILTAGLVKTVIYSFRKALKTFTY